MMGRVSTQQPVLVITGVSGSGKSTIAGLLAGQLGWVATYDAEYLALTQLQGDAFITLEPTLAEQAKAVVTIATIADLG